MSLSIITVNGQSITLVSAPTTAVLRTAEWNLYDAVALVESQFSPRAQRHWWPGADKWSGTMTYPPLTRAQMDDVTSFLMQLRGRANAFQLGDPLHTSPRGSGSGSPFVDNTGGTNLPGAITLATSGWTANAIGVLLRGDQIQVGYRLYQVLDDVSADGGGRALLNVWPSLRETPYSSGSGLAFLNATGSLGYTISRPLGNNIMCVLWSAFSMPNLPRDAIVQAIYPVIVASANHDGVSQWLQYDRNLIFNDVEHGFMFDHNYVHPSSFASTTIYGDSVGTDLALLASLDIRAALGTSVYIDPVLTDTMTISAVGYAVYYASATPTTDPQMPAPVSVPAGQGVAWSLPFACRQTGVATGGTGIFSPSSGYGLGTPAINNGGIIVNNPKGLWALSSNKRGYSEDGSKGTNATTSVSFPLEEYIAG